MLVLITAALLGLLFGSFISMASYRLPRGEDIVMKRSHCPQCQHPLAVKDLVPLFSWIFQKGKCAYCHHLISIRYPLTEVVTCLLFLGIVAQQGVTSMTLIFLMMVVALMVMIVTDFEHYFIPDSIHVVLALCAIGYAFLLPRSWLEMGLGAVSGLAIGLVLRYGFWLWKKQEGLGFGDVKFLAVVGLYITPFQFPVFFLMAGIIGIITGILWKITKRSALFPFGPALAMALMVCLLMPQSTMYFYKAVAAGMGTFIKD